MQLVGVEDDYVAFSGSENLEFYEDKINDWTLRIVGIVFCLKVPENTKDLTAFRWREIRLYKDIGVGVSKLRRVD
jgi:hypothetical protein